MEAPSKPCSPAFSIKPGISPGSNLSILSMMGNTSESKNCRHMSLTIFCSSLKSSGIKVSKALLSLMSHSPPFNRLVVVVVDIVLMFLFLIKLIYTVRLSYTFCNTSFAISICPLVTPVSASLSV